MRRLIHTVMAALLLLLAIHGQVSAGGGPAPNQWSGSGPFATGLGNRVITALAVSSDGATVYAGTGSGTVFTYAVTPPTPVTGAASGVTTTAATLNGAVNDNGLDSSVSFEYGPTITYGSSVSATPATITAGSGVTAVTAAIGSLTPGATYHYRVVATSSVGTSYGGDQSFTAHLAPSITSAADATFSYGNASSFSVTTGGSPAPALTRSGELPLGVGFTDNGNGTATIAGTPNATGTFTITIYASSSAGSTSQNFTLTVETTTVEDLSAVDANIAVTPDRHLFGVETLTFCGTPTTFTVRNIGPTPITLGTLTIDGTDAGQFAFGSDTCSAGTLAAGTACTAEVKFCPTSLGSKSAYLTIPDSVAPRLTAFLHNHESTREEATRRMPPVLERLNIPETITSGQPFTITWSLLGYDDDYLSRVALFNCSGLPVGTCGESFATNSADSGNIAPVATVTGDWTYNGVTSKRFDYSHTFTAPTVGASTDFVIRFYRKSVGDNAAGKGSLSLLVPGNVLQTGTSYYDTDGRRLKHVILP